MTRGEREAVVDDDLITVHISPVIEREPVRLDIYPQLRLANAVRIQNGATGVHEVSLELAKQLLAGARHQREQRDVGRGILTAWTALARNVERSIVEFERRGLWVDPGIDEARKRASETPARLAVGERVLCGDQEGIVVGEYQLRRVCVEDDGPYIDDEGDRVEYRLGYTVALAGSPDEHYFFSAHELARIDGQDSHLVLATVNGLAGRSNVSPLFGKGAGSIQKPARRVRATTTGWPLRFVTRDQFEQLTESEKGVVESKLKHAIESELIRRALKGPK